MLKIETKIEIAFAVFYLPAELDMDNYDDYEESEEEEGEDGGM